MLTARIGAVYDAAVVARLRAAGCVFAEDEARMLRSAAATTAELDAMVGRRVGGTPIEQIVGWAEFCGMRISVDPGVFVPRRRTEFLVDRAVALATQAPIVVDLCCGTGAIGAAVAARVAAAELHAADVEPAAVRCARRNLAAFGGRVYQGDLVDPLPDDLRGRVDLLLANVPYVPTTQIALLPPEARDHEPTVALDGGRDGLDVLRRVAAEAPQWLAPGGYLLSEVSGGQADAAVDALERCGLAAEAVSAEDTTVVIGRRASALPATG